jgi:hypothetical protein
MFRTARMNGAKGRLGVFEKSNDTHVNGNNEVRMAGRPDDCRHPPGTAEVLTPVTPDRSPRRHGFESKDRALIWTAFHRLAFVSIRSPHAVLACGAWLGRLMISRLAHFVSRSRSLALSNKS